MLFVKFKKIARELIVFFKVVLSLLLIPFFLIQVILFALRNMAIFKNDLIYIFWHWSFGHTISGLDYAARLYHPHKISLVYIPQARSNRFLPFCWQANFDIFIFPGLFKDYFFGRTQYFTARFVFLVLSVLTNRFQVIEHLKLVYKTLSVAKDKLLVGREDSGRLDRYNDYTGYLYLLHNNIGQPPALPDNLATRCIKAIQQKYPDFFEKQLVAVLLRKKGDGSSLSDSFRCAGPHKNYQQAIEYLTSCGYNVVGLGETEHQFFSNIPGYYSLSEVKVDLQLLNIFIIMKCILFIGQQSGPYVLANSCNISCLITDAMPYRVGTFNKDDLIMFKHLRLESSKRYLSVVEVFKHHKDLVYGYHFSKKRIIIEPNDPQELLAATKEMVAVLRNELKLTAGDQILIDKFNRLPSQHTSLFYQRNRLPLFMLRQMRDELLSYD